MPVIFRLLLALLLTLPTFSHAADKIDWNETALTWFDYKPGLQEMNKQKKKGFVLLYADWCPTCKAYSKLFKSKKVIKALDGLVLIKANVDNNNDINKLVNYDGGYVPKTIALVASGDISKALYPKKEEYMFYLNPDKEEKLINFINKLKRAKN